MDTKDTVSMVANDDYKERFKTEYHQTKARYEKLKLFNTKIEAARLMSCGFCGGERIEKPEHVCPDELLARQQHVMGEYLHILETRAIIEKIDL